MARYLSVYRRRPNLVDINLTSGPNATTPTSPEPRANAASYNFQVAANFDGAYTTFQNVPVSGGYRSPSVPLIGFDTEQFSQSRQPYLTRFKFAPSDYMTGGKVNTVFTSVGVSDTTPFWLRVQQVNLDGTSNTADSGMLILPYPIAPNRPILLSGNAPNAGSLASSLEIQLPCQVNNVQIQNNGSNILYVAFEPTGPEFTVPMLSSDFVNLVTTYVSVSQLFVRGGGGITQFNFIGSQRNDPMH
jgi:hypothetical protein